MHGATCKCVQSWQDGAADRLMQSSKPDHYRKNVTNRQCSLYCPGVKGYKQKRPLVTLARSCARLRYIITPVKLYKVSPRKAISCRSKAWPLMSPYTYRQKPIVFQLRPATSVFHAILHLLQACSLPPTSLSRTWPSLSRRHSQRI